MSEYSNNGNSAENEYYYDDDEITLGELFGHIFDHFLLIVVITLIFSIIGVIYARMQPKQYAVNATVSISEPYGSETVGEYGGKAFNSTQVAYEMFSQSNIENAIALTETENPDAKPIYEDVEETLLHSNVKDTDIYTISVSKTADTDYWIAFITNLVNTKMSSVSSAYLSDAENVKETIEQSLSENEALLSSSSSDSSRLETISSLKKDLRDVEAYINSLDSSIEWVTEPTAGTKDQGTKKPLICIIFFLCGGVVGVITALAIGFSDKHIYSSKKLKKIVDGKLVSSIPLYKNADDLDKREFEYIRSKLSLTDDKSITLLSLSSKAGNKTLEKGLKTVTKAGITNFGPVSDNPEALTKLSSSDYTLVILRAGMDDSIRIEKLMEDLKTVGIEDYGFVLNAVDVSDKNVTVYLGKDSYRHHKWLLESWRRYYRKNY